MEPLSIIRDLEKRSQAAGLSTAELSRRAGIAPSTFNRWRSGDSSPTLDTLARVERVIADAEKSEAA